MGGTRRREADSREPSRSGRVQQASDPADKDGRGQGSRRHSSDSRERSKRDRGGESTRRRSDSREHSRRERRSDRERSPRKESNDFSTRAGAIAGSLSGAMGRRKPAQEDEDDEVVVPQRQNQRGAADDFDFDYYDAEQQRSSGADALLQEKIKMDSRRISSDDPPKHERRKSPETASSRRHEETRKEEEPKRRTRSDSRNAKRDKRPQEASETANSVMATLSKVGAPDYSRGPNPMVAFREFLERDPVASRKYSEPHKGEKSGRKMSAREREEQLVLERFAKRQRVKEERKYLVQHGVAALSTKRLRHYDADSESSSTSSRTRRRKGKGVKAITDVARNTDKVETVKADPAAAKAALRAAASASTPEGVAAAKAAALIWGPAAAFQCGSRVRLVGLKEHSTLNGAVGRVLAPTEGTSPQVPGTVRVMLDTGTEISAKPEYVEAIKMGSSQSSNAAPPARAAAPSTTTPGGVLALQDSDPQAEAELVFATPPAVVQKRVPAKVPTMEELIEKGLELKRRRQAMEAQRNAANADAAKATSPAGEGAPGSAA